MTNVLGDQVNMADWVPVHRFTWSVSYLEMRPALQEISAVSIFLNKSPTVRG